ncbi:MAG TPA: nitroreductase family protein [Flavobacteriales bacterium]|nr:nitroreductase family protein [Flavobacteriales bacterium]HIN39301.1 nitroreductase family protein [Flavobacteriales bacterium]
MKTHKLISLIFNKLSDDEMLIRSKKFLHTMDKRRSVRDFTAKQVPKEVMENIIKTASTAPSGANKQPWSFCLVGDPKLKKKIRIAAELEEKENYSNRMSKRWLRDLNVFGTSWEKPFLEIAPWHIVVFKRVYEIENEQKHNNYYVGESVGIATGILLTAIHNAGLVSLTHTPSPMNFLSEVLERPPNERAFLLIPVGYPAENAKVPDIKRKAFDEIISYY